MAQKDIELDDIGQDQAKRSDAGHDYSDEAKRVDTSRGCMLCTEKQIIKRFDELKGGEHIQMRGRVQCCNNRSVYNHHAIVGSVQDIENGEYGLERRKTMDPTYIRLNSTDQDQPNRIGKERGCKKCTEKQIIREFGDLEGGEHIAMRGGIRCCNNRTVYSHHAIVDHVERIENDGQKADVSLLGIVDSAGQVRKENRELDLEIDKVRLVEYNMRKFDHQATKERAENFVESGLNVPYKLFTRNCETFATICVVGNDKIDAKLSHSTTRQGRNWFSGAFHCVCLGSRVISSLISFFLYITFIAGDNIIDIIPKSSAAVFSDICKFNASTAAGARDHRICHLEIQLIFIGAYVIYLIPYIIFKCRAKFTCRRCKTKSVVLALSRFLLYCLLEVLSIVVEPFVFTKIKLWILHSNRNRISLRKFVLVVVAFVKSAIECILIYWISNAIVKFIPRYLVGKKPLEGIKSVHKGDVIFWKRGNWQFSVDAIITDVHAADDTQDDRKDTIDLIYKESCSWTLFCTHIVKETCIPIDLERMKIYDFSDFSHRYSPEEVVSNAEHQLESGGIRCGFLCCNRSSNFCYSAKVKDISCPERFNSCEKCVRCFCCF